VRVVLRTDINRDETRPSIDRWEWAFEVSTRTIGLVQSVHFESGSERDVDYYCVNLTGKWSWGSYHAYYDGPHCFFSVGPLHFAWRNWKCKVCLDECGGVD